MRRLVWLGLGAAVGVVAYRRGQRLVDDSRSNGIVPTVAQASAGALASATAAAATVRAIASTPGAPAAQLGAAAATIVRGGGRPWTPQRSAVAS